MQPVRYLGLREVAEAWVPLQPGAAQNTFVASRMELKGWGCWRNIRGTGITLDEAKGLTSMAKARLKQDDLNVFDWDLTHRDQGDVDTKMMAFMWFKEEVTLAKEFSSTFSNTKLFSHSSSKTRL